jgi:hypothetical protein
MSYGKEPDRFHNPTILSHRSAQQLSERRTIVAGQPFKPDEEADQVAAGLMTTLWRGSNVGRLATADRRGHREGPHALGPCDRRAPR